MVRNRFLPTATVLTLALLAVIGVGASGAGCGLKGLAHDQLYGPTDAAVETTSGTDGDAEGGAPDVTIDVLPDLPPELSPDLPAETGTSDGASVGDGQPDADAGTGGDAGVDATPDADADGADGPVACTPATCPTDQFCDDLSGACVPRLGTGMLSGAAYDACTHMAVNAKVGIAGRHACTASGKGSFFFTQIPLGRLTVAAAAGGYELFVQEVTIVPGGNTLEISLGRSAPITCADSPPTPSACTCPDPSCVAP